MDQLDLMRLGTQARFTIRLRSFDVSLRPLTITEYVQINGEVQDDLLKQPQSTRNATTEFLIFATKVLARASTSSPDVRDPKLTEYVLGQLTPDELTYLFKEFTAHNDRVNPSLEKLPEERLNALIELVKKNPSQSIDLSFWELVNVCRALLTN